MFEVLGNKSGKRVRSKGGAACASTTFADLNRMEFEAGLAKLHTQQDAEQRKRSTHNLIGLWPVVVGIVLALLAPALSEVLAIFKPWGMGIVFPFVVLSSRPELHLGSSFLGNAPHMVLYAQFPVEGLIARSLFMRHYSSIAVAGRLFSLHILAAVLLVLVSGAIG